MSQNWTDPFSPQRVGRRIGFALLFGMGVTLCVVGPSVLRYQRITTQSQQPYKASISMDSFDRQLKLVLGRGSDVGVTANGWIISGTDPESWIVQMSEMSMDVPIQKIQLEIHQGGYQLMLYKQ